MSNSEAFEAQILIIEKNQRITENELCTIDIERDRERKNWFFYFCGVDQWNPENNMKEGNFWNEKKGKICGSG